MRKSIAIDFRPSWRIWLTLMWCGLFHRSHHIRNPHLKQIFCKKCDPQAERKHYRSMLTWKFKSPSGKRKVKEALAKND